MIYTINSIFQLVIFNIGVTTTLIEDIGNEIALKLEDISTEMGSKVIKVITFLTCNIPNFSIII